MSTSRSIPRAAIDCDEYLEGVRALLPGIRERARQTEELGRIPAETVRELDEAGVFRGLQPRQWGGLELDPVTFYESVVLIGSACGSTGWVAGVLGVHPWEIGLLADRAQEEIWGERHLTRLSSSYAPTGKAVRAAGGYRLSGQWRFSSGVDLCDWVILGAIPEGAADGDLHAFVVDKKDVVVDHESWRVAGLAGSGSKAVNLDGAFVPAYRCHSIADAERGPNPGWDVNDRPLYHLPWMSGVFSYGIAAPAIGAATGALEAFVEQSRSRVGVYGGPPVGNLPGLQFRLTNALLEVEDARLRMRNTWEQFYGLACEGKPIPEALRVRSRYEVSRIISRCLHAVLDVFEVAGGSVMQLSNPVQRFLRDLLAMKNHPMGALELTAVPFARSVLGIESERQRQERELRDNGHHPRKE